MGCVGIVFLFYMSRVYWIVDWYSIPIFSFSYLIRTAIIVFSVGAIFISLTTDDVKKQKAFEPYQKMSVFIVLALSVVSILLFSFFPQASREFGEEDGIIEWISFLVLFLSWALVILIFIKARAEIKRNIFLFSALLILGILFFFMCMEEISWGQRIIGFGSPDLFTENSQKETNLHNFFTTEADTAYYIGTCILLIYLPFLRLNFPSLFSGEFFRIIIPDTYMVIVGSFPLAFHFNKWNLLFTQIWFFSAVSILIILSKSRNKARQSIYFLITALLLILIQSAILASNESSPVLMSGRIAEYKELLSQLALCIYTIDIFFKIRQ